MNFGLELPIISEMALNKLLPLLFCMLMCKIIKIDNYKIIKYVGHL